MRTPNNIRGKFAEETTHSSTIGDLLVDAAEALGRARQEMHSQLARYGATDEHWSAFKQLDEMWNALSDLSVSAAPEGAR